MKLPDLLMRRPALAAAIALGALLASLPILLDLEVDNAPERWLDEYSEESRRYRRFVEQFGSEEFVLVIYPLPEVLDDDFLMALTDLRFDLEEVEGVRRVYCLSEVYARFFGYAGPEEFARDVAGSAFYSGFLVSEDRSLAAMWAMLDVETQPDRKLLVSSIERAVAGSALVGPVRLAGTPVVNAALDRASRSSSRFFLPAVFLLSGLVLWGKFRTPLAVVFPYLASATGIAVTLAVLQLSGRTLNMISITLPPVVWVLGLSSSIHLLSRARRNHASGMSSQVAASRALASLWLPCSMSAVTTALGFLALTSSDLRPIWEMGVFSALGVLLCLAANVLYFPLFGRWALDRGLAAHVGARKGASRLAPPLIALVRLHPWRVLGTSVAAALIFAAGLPLLRSESNVLTYLEADQPVSITYRDVLPRLTGPSSLELVLALGDKGLDFDTAPDVDRLVARLEEVPGVARVLSPVDLVKKMHQIGSGAPAERFDLPTGEEDWGYALERAERDLEPELESLLGPEGLLRLSILAWPTSSSEHEALVRMIEEQVAIHGDPAWRPQLTGIVDLLVRMHGELVRSQLKSFGLAFVLIFAVILLWLRSVRYACFSLGPNLLPVMVALGVMGWLEIELDAATVMIAAMALGIAVDNTIHFLVRYRRDRRKSLSPRDAATTALDLLVGPMALTTAVAALGFAVLALADFVPLVHFGGLTVLTLFTALIGDLLVLPASLVLFDRAARQSGAH